VEWVNAVVAIWFQSTPSGGKATEGSDDDARGNGFQSTPSGGKATCANDSSWSSRWRFNPRLPGGRRRGVGDGDCVLLCFNPRLPGGRRLRRRLLRSARASFNPRLPGGRRPHARADCSDRLCVSIHAFRGEGDPQSAPSQLQDRRFNPRLPGGRRRIHIVSQRQKAPVSIHAFRGEGDVAACRR